MTRETKRKVRWGALTLAVTICAMVAAAMIWAPWYFEGKHVRDARLAPSAGIIITGFRTTLIALFAGIIAALGLYYTSRNHELARKQLEKVEEQFQLAQSQFEHAQEQFLHTQARDREQAELTRESQVTDRYVEAIKLLSSENVTQRLGGIYSLERIMRDSTKDRRTVLEVLSAFIRTPPPVEQNAESENSDVSWEEPPSIRPDVQAALTVIARRDYAENEDTIDLSSSSLRRADLRKARLAKINLRGADLCLSDLERADLNGADLSETAMRGAQMNGATLRKADLTRADLRNAILSRADMTDASFEEVQLEDAKVSVAEIVRACIYDSTELPEELAQNDIVQGRIAKLEKARKRKG